MIFGFGVPNKQTNKIMKMKRKKIEFEHTTSAEGVASLWTTTSETRFKEQCIDPDYADRRLKFPIGETWLRIVPALRASSFGWMLGLHTINTPHGRHVHTKTLLPGAKSAFDHAYSWLRDHKPESLYCKTNKDGARLLTSPMCLFWVITEVDNKPVTRLILASGYDGSRGGAAGLGYRILQLTQERSESGELVCDPTNPLTGPQICVTKIQADGAKYPSYTLRCGRDAKPLNELIESMDPGEQEAIVPIEGVVHLPDLDEEWDLLAEVLDKDTVTKIKDSVS